MKVKAGIETARFAPFFAKWIYARKGGYLTEVQSCFHAKKAHSYSQKQVFLKDNDMTNLSHQSTDSVTRNNPAPVMACNVIAIAIHYLSVVEIAPSPSSFFFNEEKN